jgi:sec-independent protein translocase protein TatB
MFDLGFSELMVIALVALIVIGPERLPRVARTLGHLAGRLQRYVADVKADIDREVELDELRKMRDTMQSAASDLQSSFDKEVNKTTSELNAAVEGGAQEAEPAPKADAPKAVAEAGSEAQVPSPPKTAASIEENQKHSA